MNTETEHLRYACLKDKRFIEKGFFSKISRRNVSQNRLETNTLFEFSYLQIEKINYNI